MKACVHFSKGLCSQCYLHFALEAQNPGFPPSWRALPSLSYSWALPTSPVTREGMRMLSGTPGLVRLREPNPRLHFIIEYSISHIMQRWVKTSFFFFFMNEWRCLSASHWRTALSGACTVHTYWMRSLGVLEYKMHSGECQTTLDGIQAPEHLAQPRWGCPRHMWWLTSSSQLCLVGWGCCELLFCQWVHIFWPSLSVCVSPQIAAVIQKLRV